MYTQRVFKISGYTEGENLRDMPSLAFVIGVRKSERTLPQAEPRIAALPPAAPSLQLALNPLLALAVRAVLWLSEEDSWPLRVLR